MAKDPIGLTVVRAPIRAPKGHEVQDYHSVQPALELVPVSRARLFDLLDQVKVLAPCSRNPHRFHELKSDICAELYDLATG